MGFDWITFAFQVVNVLILLAILRHFLFRPVARIIAERQAEIARTLSEAEKTKAAAAKAGEDARAEAEKTAAARHDALARARAEAEAQAATILEAARDEAEKIKAAAREEAQAEQRRAEAEQLARASALALDLAERLMQSLPEDRRVAGYAARLAEVLASLPADRRRALFDSETPQLIAPRPLSDSEAAEVQAALAPYFKTTPPVSVDPGLIAGLELRGRHGSIGNSLRHDLTRIAQVARNEG
jgi:F-type H+-transporting ATPase subunit b